MKATIIEAPHQMTVGSWDTPTPTEGEVLIKVKAAGICAGDLYFYMGKNPYARYPQVCGHEIAGVVADLGKGVKSFKTGDAVVVEPYVGCGTCYPCRVGKPNCCAKLEIIGVHRAGGYAEYLVAPAFKVHKFPEKLNFTLASFVEPPTHKGVNGLGQCEVRSCVLCHNGASNCWLGDHGDTVY